MKVQEIQGLSRVANGQKFLKWVTGSLPGCSIVRVSMIVPRIGNHVLR